MSTEDPAIAITGAGNVGRALVRRLVAAGTAAAAAEVVFLAVPGAAAVAAVTGLERPGPGD